MLKKRNALVASLLVLLALTVTVPAARADTPTEYEAIVSHLKAKYHAKKVHIPFMWLARAAVHIARPAGVKSFNITLFDGLTISGETLDIEMKDAMRRSFGPEWS